MKKRNFLNCKSDKNLVRSNKNYFVGQVEICDLSKTIESKEEKIYHVTFYKGARTKIHYHQAGQTLIVTEGEGKLEVYSSKYLGQSLKLKKLNSVNLSQGDIVYVSPKKLHWHGAIGNKKFSHIAVNAKLPGYIDSKTIWYESDSKLYAKKIFS